MTKKRENQYVVGFSVVCIYVYVQHFTQQLCVCVKFSSELLAKWKI